MKCKDYSVRQVMIGLHRVGIVGLHNSIVLATGSGLKEREAIVDLILESLRPDNYIPDGQVADYRTTLWREYLRHRGEDITELYTAVPVVVRGEADEERERFVELVRAAMALFELRPAIEFAPPAEGSPNPQLVIDDAVVARGPQSRHGMERAVRQSLSDW